MSHTLGMALIWGGGVSNFADRILSDGRVVDFLNLGIGSLRTGIFNVADVAIMAGVGLLILAWTRNTKGTTNTEGTHGVSRQDGL
jgi:signal peptidase II